MMRCWTYLLLSAAAFAPLSGCRMPGKPGPDYVPVRPDQVANFDELYRTNCQACHGPNGRGGTAISLGNPAYIAYAGREHIAQITAQGIGGSLMPAFATGAGGSLTDKQIGILADGIVSRWAKPEAMGGTTPPPYESQAKGDAAAGEGLYRANCMRCHAAGPSSILSPTYLALISDGGLRTWIVAGKPEAGMPDWRGYPGGALNDQQIANLVSFLVSHRIATPGQPFPNAAGSSAQAQTNGTANTPPQAQAPASDSSSTKIARSQP